MKYPVKTMRMRQAEHAPTMMGMMSSFTASGVKVVVRLKVGNVNVGVVEIVVIIVVVGIDVVVGLPVVSFSSLGVSKSIALELAKFMMMPTAKIEKKSIFFILGIKMTRK